jgi:hypothetical protein
MGYYHCDCHTKERECLAGGRVWQTEIIRDLLIPNPVRLQISSLFAIPKIISTHSGKDLKKRYNKPSLLGVTGWIFRH